MTRLQELCDDILVRCVIGLWVIGTRRSVMFGWTRDVDSWLSRRLLPSGKEEHVWDCDT